MINLTPIINALIVLLFAIVMSVVMPLLKKHLTAKQLDEMLDWVEIAVAAAQQLYHHLDGSERKKYVKKFLADKGYDVHTDEVDAAIEAAVLELHNRLGI